MKREICIIKTGCTELLESGENHIISLGEVFRTTALLHLFPHDNVTWITSSAAWDLLDGIPAIATLVRWDDIKEQSGFFDKKFDLLINLEKNRDICMVARRIGFVRMLGFRWDMEADALSACNPEAAEIMSLAGNYKLRNAPSSPCFQESVFHIVDGSKWTGQGYFLARPPSAPSTFDVGFNTEVGKKWPTKKWPRNHWVALERILTGRGISISWQRGLANLHEYIEWINSCGLLVTNDSLCVHLAQALDKQIVMLVGPTFSTEVNLAHTGVKLTANSDCPRNPCFSGECDFSPHCMQAITPEEVAEAVMDRLLIAEQRKKTMLA